MRELPALRILKAIAGFFNGLKRRANPAVMLCMNKADLKRRFFPHIPMREWRQPRLHIRNRLPAAEKQIFV